MTTSLMGVDPTAVSASPLFALGQVAWDSLGRAFVYVQATEVVAAGYCCIIHGGYTCEGVTITNAAVGTGCGKMCGVAMAAFADNEYGWLCVFGTGSDVLVDCNAAAVAFTRLRPTAVAGHLDDTTTATEPLVNGIVVVTASSGDEQEIAILRWPYLQVDLII